MSKIVVQARCIYKDCPDPLPLTSIELPELQPGVIAWPELRCSNCLSALWIEGGIKYAEGTSS